MSQEHQEIQHCFKRFNFASTSYNDKIWVHGGNNGKAVLSDFWSFETKTGKLTIFRNVHHNRHEFIDIPPLEGHQMVYVTRNGIDSLLIIGHDCRSFRYNAFRKDLQFFLISNVNNIDNIHYGKSYTNSGIDFTMYCHPISDHTIPSKIHFTATVMGVENGVKYELLIFGGLNWSNNVATNDLYLIGFNLEEMVWVNGLYAPSVSVRNLLPNQSSSAGILSQPAARYGHSAIAINGNLYIFGGKSNSAFYNDLWFFDIQQKLWLEIDITGSIPPGIAFFGLFSYSPQTLLIYGGSSAKSTSNSIYSYDTGTKEWSIVKVKGHGSGKDSRPEKLQKACYGLQTAVSGTQMYRIGGKFADDVLFTVDVLSNIQDPGHRYYLCDYLRKLKQSGIFADVIFRVSEKLDSEKCARELEESDVIHEFVAHRAVILARCKYLSNLINESTNIVQPEGITENYTTRERIVVDISDCNASVFEAYLHFLYTGELELVGQKNLESLVGICRKWCPDTHFPIISELCYPTGRLQLTTIEKVVVQFEQDFEKLIDNADSFPDITLKLGNEKDANFVYAHKAILCRSEFFRSMFCSGMQESFSEIIEVPNYEINVMFEILRYCYTDKIHLTLENVVGCLIVSRMFNLPDITNSARNLVEQCLNISNVCPILEVADTYNDNGLKRMCLIFMRDNYDDLISSKSFQNLEIETRSKVIDMVNKKKKQCASRK